MMFLLRLAFWVGLIVLLLPTDERQQARLYETASSAVQRAITFCDRNPTTCAVGGELWATFTKKAEFAARMVFDLASGRKDDTAAPSQAPADPRTDQRLAPASRGTLTPSDLTPAWRGSQPPRGA